MIILQMSPSDAVDFVVHHLGLNSSFPLLAASSASDTTMVMPLVTPTTPVHGTSTR